MSIATVDAKWMRIVHLKAVANNPSESDDSRAAAQAEIEHLMSIKESNQMPLDLQEVVNAPEVPFETAPSAPPQEEHIVRPGENGFLYYLNGAVVNEDGEVVSRSRICEVLGWTEIPEVLSEEQAEQVGFKMAQAQRDAQSYFDNAEKKAKPIRGWYQYLYDQFGRMLHQYAKSRIPRYTKGKNVGKPKVKYLQLASCRISLGKGSGGVSVFDADAYDKWKHSLSVEQLTEYGGYIELKINHDALKTLHEDDFAFLKELGAEIHFGHDQLTLLMTREENPVHIPGTKIEPVDELGVFKGVE